jgi:hypothetical protein
MYAERLPSQIDNLQFALSVLQEHSGLGLDPEYLSKIRSVILQQIEERKAALYRRPAIATVASLEHETVAS